MHQMICQTKSPIWEFKKSAIAQQAHPPPQWDVPPHWAESSHLVISLVSPYKLAGAEKTQKSEWRLIRYKEWLPNQEGLVQARQLIRLYHPEQDGYLFGRCDGNDEGESNFHNAFSYLVLNS